MKRSLTARRLLLLSFFFLEVVSLRHDVLGIAAMDELERFAEGTEALVIGRVARSEQAGLFSDGGLLLWDVSETRGRDRFSRQEEIYVEDVPMGRLKVYRSHPGLQGLLFGIVDRLSPFPDRVNLSLFDWIASLSSAAVFTLLVAWILRVAGRPAAATAAVGLLCAPWIVVSGGHLYWLSGMYFMPFLAVAVSLERPSIEGSGGIVAGIAGASFFVKSLFTGFELVTASLVMCTVPVVFVAFRDRWSFRRFSLRFGQVSVGLTVGLSMAVLVLLLQNAQLEGTETSGLEHLEDRLVLRTVGESTTGRTMERVAESRGRTLGEVMNRYWNTELLRLPGAVRARIRPGVPTDSLLLFGVLLAMVGSAVPSLRPLSIATLYSFSAPASWFVIFRSHAYLHPFLVPLVWYLPSVPLVCALVGSWGGWLWDRSRRWGRGGRRGGRSAASRRRQG